MKYFSDEGFIKIDEKQVGAPEDKVADLLNVSVDELRNVSRKVGISNSKGGIYDIDGKYYYSSHEVIFKVRNENGKKSADLSTNELIKIFQKAESRLLSADVVKKKRTKENIIGGILIVAIIFGIGSCFFGGDDKKNTNQPTKKVEQTKPVEKQKVLSAAEEKIVYQNFKNQIQRGLVAVDNDWDTLWSPTIQNFANGALDEKTVFQTLRQLEQNLINDEMIIYEAYNSLYDNIPANTVLSQETQNKMKQITDDYQQWIQQRRKSSENFRQALGIGKITPEKIQETINMINQADAIMLGATGKLAELENKFK